MKSHRRPIQMAFEGERNKRHIINILTTIGKKKHWFLINVQLERYIDAIFCIHLRQSIVNKVQHSLMLDRLKLPWRERYAKSKRLNYFINEVDCMRARKILIILFFFCCAKLFLFFLFWEFLISLVSAKCALNAKWSALESNECNTFWNIFSNKLSCFSRILKKALKICNASTMEVNKVIRNRHQFKDCDIIIYQKMPIMGLFEMGNCKIGSKKKSISTFWNDNEQFFFLGNCLLLLLLCGPIGESPPKKQFFFC